jgi:hypothetical protein
MLPSVARRRSCLAAAGGGAGAGAARRWLSRDSRDPSRDVAPAALAKLRSVDILMDRYQAAVYEDDPALRLLGAGWLAQKRARLGSYIKTTRALGATRRKDPLFTPGKFSALCEPMFQELHNSLALGELDHGLFEVATETLGELVRTRPLHYAELAGTPQLTQITSFLAPPSLVQARLVQLNAVNSDLVFAQLTVLFKSEARVVSAADLQARGGRRNLLAPAAAAARGTAGVHATGHGNSNVRSLPRTTPLSRQAGGFVQGGYETPVDREPGRFCVAFDSAKGAYYYHTQALTTTWKRPLNYLVSKVYTLPKNGTLGVTGRTVAENALDGTVQQEHVVVFERPLFNLATPWRVAFF